MPFYKAIDATTSEGRRTIEGLQRLRAMTLPTKTVDSTLMLASWNLRELGGTKSGGRELEPMLYIAEIISRFDLVAVQEVRDDLDTLERLMELLGSWWKFLVSDVTYGRAGNKERHAFLYDSRKLRFGGFAGELAPETTKNEDGTLGSKTAFARSPYVAGFEAGWFKFTLCTQHFYYGKSKPDDPQRLMDAMTVARLLGLRRKSKDRWANNAILLGDFNVFSTKDKTYEALTSEGFEMPAGLAGQYTNAALDKPFDHIAFLAPDVQRQVAVCNAGVVAYYDHVYREADWQDYGQKSLKAFRQWRTYKMSDHLPIWVELGIDFTDDYLARRLAAELAPGEPASVR